ncbi:MAG: NTP transferase domain-containing protein [Ignavibacteria bacterium]|nr:NTP transferase domain-containing protein [Ignavibacteria bacterium]
MDAVDSKLLIVFENEKFISLLSLGDLQRAIIANKSFDSPISEFLRKDIVIGAVNESFEEIKAKMKQFRTEFMPIIDETGNIIKLYFWDEIFVTPFYNNGDKLKLPVVIMAGGIGSRLKPITNIIPKALVPIGDKPIIERIIDNFNKFGADKFIISANYKADMLKYYFSNKESNKYKVSFIQEERPLGTAGSLALLKGQMSTTFFVSNCDIIIEQDYREILKYHVINNNEITVVASLKNYPIPYGVLETGENGNLISIKEKPEITYLINTGLYILEPHLLDELPDNHHYHITDLIEKIKNRNGKIGVFPVSEKSLLDIGEWKLYQQTMELQQL